MSSFDLSRTVQDLGGTVVGPSRSGQAAVLPRERGQDWRTGLGEEGGCSRPANVWGRGVKVALTKQGTVARETIPPNARAPRRETGACGSKAAVRPRQAAGCSGVRVGPFQRRPPRSA